MDTAPRVNGDEARIEPFHFGASAAPLFGLFHAPAASSARDCSVVICPPMGHEYIQFHRALRMLGERLCAAGFPVLRFDYFGCGDSGGNSDEGTVEQWRLDVAAATREAVRRSGRRPACLIGLRLGGSLAVLSGAETQEVDGLVLWDPIVEGGAYLAEIHALHREMMRTAHVLPDPRPGAPARNEALGFPLTEALAAGLGRIDLRSLARRPARRALVVETTGGPGARALGDHLERIGTATDHRAISTSERWAWVEDLAKVPVPLPVIRSIVQWAADTYR